MRLRRRRKKSARPTFGTLQRRLRSKVVGLGGTIVEVARLFGWLYVVVLVPALLVATYLVVRSATSGGDVLRSLHLFPLAMIWPLAAVALRSEGAFSLTFPLNALALVAAVAFVIVGWTVLIRLGRDVFRWRPGGARRRR
jgi:hypothetical protein